MDVTNSVLKAAGLEEEQRAAGNVREERIRSSDLGMCLSSI